MAERPDLDHETRGRIVRALIRRNAGEEALTVAATMSGRTSGAALRLAIMRSTAARLAWRFEEAEDHARAALRIDVWSAPALRARELAQDAQLATTPGWWPAATDDAAAREGPVQGRILHLVARSLPFAQGGYTVRTQSIAAAQRGAGLDPLVVTRQASALAEHDVSRDERAERPVAWEVDGIPYRSIAGPDDDGPPSAMRATAWAAAALAMAREVRPALIHAATPYDDLQVGHALRAALGIPLVYEVRGFTEDSWRSHDAGRSAEDARYVRLRALETAAMRDADAIVTLSRAMRDEIVARGGIDPDRVAIIPNAVDAERFTPRPADPALVASLGLEGRFVAGTITTISAYEGLEVLVHAVARLRSRGLPVSALIVGEGAPAAVARLRETAAELGLGPRDVVLAGAVPHAAIEAYHAIIDAFVVPRRRERIVELVTPLKPFEAMAMARPVVASDLPALREVVIDGQTGCLVPPDDPEALAGALAVLAHDPAACQRLGAAARAWVIAQRSWRANGERYRALYRALGAV